MANYTSSFTGEHNDEYDSRITSLFNLDNHYYRILSGEKINRAGDDLQGFGLHIHSSNLDGLNTPTSNTLGDANLRFLGADNSMFGGVRPTSETNGWKGIQVYVINSNAPTDSTSCGLKLLADDSGNTTVYTNNTNAWETGIATLEAIDTLSSIITVDSANATIDGYNFARWGKVAYIGLTWKNNNAITIPNHGNVGNIRIGTIVAGKRPRYDTVGYSDGDDAGDAGGCLYRVYHSGEIYLAHCDGTGTERTIAKNTSGWRIRVMYILP